MHRCSYCTLGTQFKPMRVLANGRQTCESCGHVVFPGDKLKTLPKRNEVTEPTMNEASMLVMSAFVLILSLMSGQGGARNASGATPQQASSERSQNMKIN